MENDYVRFLPLWGNDNHGIMPYLYIRDWFVRKNRSVSEFFFLSWFGEDGRRRSAVENQLRGVHGQIECVLRHVGSLCRLSQDLRRRL